VLKPLAKIILSFLFPLDKEKHFLYYRQGMHPVSNNQDYQLPLKMAFKGIIVLWKGLLEAERI